MDFRRQRNIFNPENSNLKVCIIGAGSTGSFYNFNIKQDGN